MHRRAPATTGERNFSAASKSAALLLCGLVLASGLLTGIPAVVNGNVLAQPPVADSSAGPGLPSTASDPSLENPPALAADLTASGARLLWESPSGNLTEPSRLRSGPGNALTARPFGSSAFRVDSLANGGADSAALSQRLLLQTAQLSAG